MRPTIRTLAALMAAAVLVGACGRAPWFEPKRPTLPWIQDAGFRGFSEHGVWVDGTRFLTRSWNTRDKRRVKSFRLVIWHTDTHLDLGGRDPETVWQAMRAAAENVGPRKHLYLFDTENDDPDQTSNSVVAAALRAAGIAVDAALPPGV